MDEQIITIPEKLLGTDITQWLETTISEVKGNFIIICEKVAEPAIS